MGFSRNLETGYTHLLDVRPLLPEVYMYGTSLILTLGRGATQMATKHGQLHWLMEGIGEFTGVFFYVYCGVGATAAFNIGNLSKIAGIGSLLTVGFAYALGIATAVAIAGSNSGGHFNPCVTISHAVWHGFPWRKVIPFMFWQILGAYFACFLVYGQELESALIASNMYDQIQFTPNGVAGIFALYTQPGANLRDVFMNEFFVDFFLGMIIWGAMDPTNYFVPPPVAPWIIGLAYAVMIWDFSPAALSANTARDLGARLMAITVWGTKANGGAYAAISALTNIPATLLATFVYEIFFTDSSRVLPMAQQDFLNGHKAHLDHKKLDPSQRIRSSTHNSTEKASFQVVDGV